jgi:hypothetical protein
VCSSDLIESFNPYRRVEAETMAWGYGFKTERMSGNRLSLTNIDDNESLCLKGVDFGTGAKAFSASIACVTEGSRIEIRLDGVDGPLVGTLKVKSSGAMDRYADQSCTIQGASGTHDLYFCFKSNAQKSNLFHIDHWSFK